MNLSEFVEESLTEILAGIRAAQLKDGGQAIGAKFPGAIDKGLLISGGTYGTFTVVDFDVSVVADTKGGVKGGVKVWGIGGVEAGGGISNQHTSRVKFSVQLRIPDGAKGPKSTFNDPIDYPDHPAI